MQLQSAIKGMGKAALESAHRYSYDNRHKKEALAIVFTMEKHNLQKLSALHKKAADEYSVEILGSRNYAPWLYVYTLVSGEFKEGWIPDNFFGRLVVPKINKGICVDLKTLTKILFQTQSLPDLGYHIDGVLYDSEMSIIDIDDLRDIVRRTHGDVFVKSDRTSRGRGVAKVSEGEIDAALFDRMGNCVIQESIRQHEALDQIVSGVVATIRITTVKENSGRINMRAAYLRVGRNNAPWVQASNSVRVAVINKEGDLGCFGYTADWRRWPSHPDTGFVFENQRIPRFAEAMDLCIELHRRLPHASIIGWDVTVGDDEAVKIIEWNAGHCDIKFSEANTGPCFIGLNWERLRD